MKIEVRADSVNISGYVNTTERDSRPVITRHGRVIERIEQRAFERALSRAGNIELTVDHDKGHVYATTEQGTLELYEDNIGLHADVLIVDPTLIEIAKQGKIRGWSFGMRNVVDNLEQRADALPLRTIKDFDLDHITLVVNKNPIYSATSVEVRAEEEIDLEIRANEDTPKITQAKAAKPDPVFFDNSGFKNRVEALEK